MPTSLTGVQWTAINGGIAICTFVASLSGTGYMIGRWTQGVESRIDAIVVTINQFQDSRTDARANNERRFSNIERQLEAAAATGASNAQQLGLLTQTVASSVAETNRRQADAERRISELEGDRIPTVTKMTDFSGKIDRLSDQITNIQRAFDEQRGRDQRSENDDAKERLASRGR